MIKDIINLMTKYEEFLNIEGSVDEKIIESMEKKIGIVFPKEYREYLKLYGSGCVRGFSIAGVVPGFSLTVEESINNWRKKGLENKFIPIYDVDEFVYVLDSAIENGPVYIYRGDEMIKTNLSKVNNNFVEFVISQIENRIQDMI